MSCECRPSCNKTAIVISIILGIVAFFLRLFYVIIASPVFLWVVFGVAVLFLALAFYTFTRNQASAESRCKCSILPILLVGIIGTILTSVVLLLACFIPCCIIAIITGFLIFFFSLLLISIANLILCKAGCKNCE